jgi:type VI secretion system secreted protein Hcp
MAVDVFLKIDGVKGESADDKHKDEIDVLAWDWGMSQSGTTHTGTGAGSGKVEVRDLTVTKYVDKATPNLMKACCNGQHYKTALLTVRKAGGKSPVEYYKLKMEDVIITNIQSGGSGDQDRLTETVSLDFGKMTVDYTPQKADGSADAAVTIGWNIAANKEI